jgi:hypothetical protein
MAWNLGEDVLNVKYWGGIGCVDFTIPDYTGERSLIVISLPASMCIDALKELLLTFDSQFD